MASQRLPRLITVKSFPQIPASVKFYLHKENASSRKHVAIMVILNLFLIIGLKILNRSLGILFLL